VMRESIGKSIKGENEREDKGKEREREREREKEDCTYHHQTEFRGETFMWAGHNRGARMAVGNPAA